MIDKLSIAVHAFAVCMFTPHSVNELLLPRYLRWFTNYLPFNVDMAPSCLKHMNTVLSEFT